MSRIAEIRVTLPKDKEGFTGRECPNSECLKYFKVEFGTGLKDTNHCFCPYCGHKGLQNTFYTQAQIDYARSVARNEGMRLIQSELKKLERTIDAGFFKIQFKVDRRNLDLPVQRYYEKELETIIVCDQCTLRYAIYGLYGFCPDCGTHNSLQIFKANLNIVNRYLEMAQTSDPAVAEKLIGDALENCVTEFQSFAKATFELVVKCMNLESIPHQPSFQNPQHAKDWLQSNADADISMELTDAEWSSVVRCFQKRHVIAHRAGVADEDYVRRSGDPDAVVGRKVRLQEGEVEDLARHLSRVAENLASLVTSHSAQENT